MESPRRTECSVTTSRFMSVLLAEVLTGIRQGSTAASGHFELATG